MNKWILIPFIFRLVLRGDLRGAQAQSGDATTQEQQITAQKRKAASGDVKSQVTLGIAYASGDGVQADETEAVKWFRKAAEQGDADGEYVLGEMYATGRGVAVDYAEALRWLRKAAEQGDPRGEFDLAAMYTEGKGVPKDKDEAAKWIRKAAEQGFAAGQFGLGMIMPMETVFRGMRRKPSSSIGRQWIRVTRRP
jgi:TPR repeat protein